MQNPRYRQPDFEDSEYDEDWYDANGNIDPSGIYDVGGHMDGERAASRGEWILDQIRDRGI